MNDWFYAVVTVGLCWEIEEVYFSTEEKAEAYADKMRSYGYESNIYMTKGD